MPVLDAFLSVLAPFNCLVCGEEGKIICDWCIPDAFPVVPSRCYRCKKLTVDNATCEKCRKSSPLIHVWISTEYENHAKNLLHIYKFERARSSYKTIASVMNDSLPFIRSNTLIVPVPTATSRSRQRGYDQAVLLARKIAKDRGLMWDRAVTRTTQSRQVGASREQRYNQLKSAFIVTNKKLIKGADILVVDDVVTTGATIEAVARVLKNAGAKSVNAVAFATKMNSY